MTSRHAVRAASSAAALLALAGSAQAQVSSATMLTSGLWSNAGNWTTNPRVPNNGQPSAMDTYNVFLFNRAATLDQDVTINDLSLQHSSGITNVIDNPSAMPHTLNILGIFSFRQGNLAGNNTYVIMPSAVMNFLPTPVGQLKQLNAMLMNQGVINVDFITTLQSTGPGTHLTNEAGGVINFNNLTTLSQTAGSTGAKFTNKPGAVINNGATINWEFDNQGTVNLNTVSLNANRGGTHTGTFNVAQNRTMRFGGTGFTHSLSPESVLSGTGSVEFATNTNVQTTPGNYNVNRTVVNGEVIFEGTAEEFDYIINQIEMASGKLQGANFGVDSVVWRGGEINSNVTINQGGVLDGQGTPNPASERTLSGNLTNNGQANLKGLYRADNSMGPGTLTNNGMLNSVPGTTTFSGNGTFSNNGTFEVASGTTTIAWTLQTTRDSVIEVTPGAGFFALKAKLLDGIMVVEGGAIADFLLQDGEAFFELAAMVELGAEATLQANDDFAASIASDVRGTGRFSIDGRFETFGQTNPGNSPGTLTIEAPVTELHPEHRLNMELGAPGSAEVDLLIVNGNLTLGGTLNVAALPGFGAGTYTLIDCSGTITDRGLAIGGFPAGFLGRVVVDHLAGEVRLLVTPATECTADFDGNGTVTSQDFFSFLTAFFNADPTADINDDAEVNSQDFFDFLAAFFAGC